MVLTTKAKIFGAKILYQLVTIGRNLIGGKNTVLVNRGGLNWRLTLSEGIDFSIYLLGAFEKSTGAALRGVTKPGDVVLDLGANIGAHTLPLALAVGPRGHIYSFEPTNFAFQKLTENLALNPELVPRVTAEQSFLVADRESAVPDSVYSSWPLTASEGLHEKHLGHLNSTSGAYSTTLDDYVEARAITRVDLVKLDVDGNEMTVLQGAKRTLTKFCPTILMEVSPYVHGEGDQSFSDLIQVLRDCGYRHVDILSGKRMALDADLLQSMVPDGAGINCFFRGDDRPSGSYAH